MSDTEFRAFLDLLMCSDPWPVFACDSGHEILVNYANKEALNHGFSDWIHAYHNLPILQFTEAKT